MSLITQNSLLSRSSRYWNKSTIGAAFVLLALAIALASPLIARAFAPPVADSEKSVVTLDATWEATGSYPGPKGRVYVPLTLDLECSGFFVSHEADVMTAHHCISESDASDELRAMLTEKIWELPHSQSTANAMDNLSIEEITGTFTLSQPEGVPGAVLGTTRWHAEVVDSWPGSDVAFLRLNTFKGKTPALKFAAHTPEIGTTVTTIGFPGALGSVVDEGTQRASFKQGSVSSHQTRHGAAISEIDAALLAGMSGGPVLDDERRVVGIAIASIRGAQPFNFVTGTENTREYLVRYGIVDEVTWQYLSLMIVVTLCFCASSALLTILWRQRRARATTA